MDIILEEYYFLPPTKHHQLFRQFSCIDGIRLIPQNLPKNIIKQYSKIDQELIRLAYILNGEWKIYK